MEQSLDQLIDYDPSSPTYQQLTDVYIVSAGENYPVIEPEDDDGQYTVDHVAVVKPSKIINKKI